jgi:hypothetical protein
MRARPPKPDKRSWASPDGGWLLPPPEPTPAHRDGVLRQGDVPTLPPPVPGCSFVYQLLDPITGEPQYVGRTRTPAIRRRGHRDGRSDKRSAVNEWHRRLALHGLRPVMRILDGPLPYREAARREETWRRAHLAAGFELLNAVPCVDGRHEGDAIWSERAAQRGPSARQATGPRLLPHSKAVRRQRTQRARQRYRAPARRTQDDRSPAWTRDAHTGVDAPERRTRRAEAGRDACPRALSDSQGVHGCRRVRSVPGDHDPIRRTQGVRATARASPRSDWTSRSVDFAIGAVAAQVSSGTRYPTDREMRQHGPPGLPGAASRFGGNRARAARLGLRMTRHRWDPETAAAAVLDLVRALSLDRYPTEKQFRDARTSGLYCAIANHLGGHAAMAAARLHLPRAARRSK